MRRLVSAFFMIVLLVVLGACSQIEPEPGAEVEPTVATDPDATGSATPLPEDAGEAGMAIEAARLELAEQLGVTADEIVVVSSSETEWPNGCLGLAEPGEMCTEALVSGWLVILRAPGEEGVFEARTDRNGQTVRFRQTADPATELPVAAVRAREALAEELGIGIADIEVVSFSQEEWRDSCLGLGGPAESCLQVITPGWRVVLATEGEEYEAHTDRTGDSVRFADNAKTGSAGPLPAGVVVLFEQSGGFAGDTIAYRIYRDGMIEKVTGTSGPDEKSEAYPGDAGAVEQLLADIEAAGFFALDEDQMPADPCCDRFSYTLTVFAGEQMGTIRTVEATEGVPDAVWASIELVRRFVETDGTNPTS
jgi:hypothetical protein